MSRHVEYNHVPLYIGIGLFLDMQDLLSNLNITLGIGLPQLDAIGFRDKSNVRPCASGSRRTRFQSRYLEPTRDQSTALNQPGKNWLKRSTSAIPR